MDLRPEDRGLHSDARRWSAGMGFVFDTRSVFLRRLLLVLSAVAIGLAALAAQSARLTLLSGDAHLADAEAKLVRETWTPTVRGRIRDRAGRVLAFDRPAFDIAVEYDVITGEWSQRQAAAHARRITESWSQLDNTQRRRVIESLVPQFKARENRTWSLIAEATGKTLSEVDGRRLDIQDQVRRMATTVRSIRERGALYDYAGTLGYRRAELDRRAQELDRPDLLSDADRLRFILAEEITREAEDDIEDSVSRPLREETIAHVIEPAVADEVGFRLRRAQSERDPEFDRLPMYPGLRVIDSGDRAYPLDTIEVPLDRSLFPQPLRRDTTQSVTVRGVARHVLGTVRRGIFAEDVTRRAEAIEAQPDLRDRSMSAVGTPRDRGRYFAGDTVGSTGLEKSLEDTLRGLRGLRVDRLDDETPLVLPPEPGRDVTLTLDVMLQARIQALLEPEAGLTSVQKWHDNSELVEPEDPRSELLMPVGTAMDAAAVVIDIETGDLLALVSTPTLARDGSGLPTNQDKRRKHLELHRPHINRALSFPIPPGSIAKSLVLCGAHRAGALETGERISCTGHFHPGRPGMLRCWIFKHFNGVTHDIDLGHAPDAAEALKVSCNIFFYTLGQRLGPEGIAAAYRAFGVGEDLGLPLASVRGWLGPFGRSDAISEGDAIQMGIGQGTVAWTPVHAADTFATIARGGVRIKPRLLADQEPIASDLGLDPAIVQATLRGLDLAVNDPRGTAHSIEYDHNTQERFTIFDVPGVRVWGKTGTATAPPLVIDDAVVRRGDHSWFVLLAGRSKPQYAVAVVVEYGGSGGRVSGPIANQVVHALVAEGYL
ncbi:MAG: penicillin-binding transpeptidase domain-containing protein [Planctomycetota bacterium]